MARTRTAPPRRGPVAVDDATDAVLRVSRLLVGIAAQSLAATEDHLTLPQYRALVALGVQGPQNVGALAELLGLHPTTLTRLADRLVKGGWIDRTTSPDNRREATVQLTPQGRTLFRAETKRRREAIRAVVERLDGETQREIVHALRALTEEAAHMSQEAWRLGWAA